MTPETNTKAYVQMPRPRVITDAEIWHAAWNLYPDNGKLISNIAMELKRDAFVNGAIFIKEKINPVNP